MHMQPGYTFIGGSQVAGTSGDQDWSATLYGSVVASKVGGTLTFINATTSPVTSLQERARAMNGARHDGGVSGYRVYWNQQRGVIECQDSKGAATPIVTSLVIALPNRFISPRAQGSLDPDLQDEMRREN